MQPSTTQPGWQGMESRVGMETMMLSSRDPAESAERAALRKQTCACVSVPVFTIKRVRIKDVWPKVYK